MANENVPFSTTLPPLQQNTCRIQTITNAKCQYEVEEGFSLDIECHDFDATNITPDEEYHFAFVAKNEGTEDVYCEIKDPLN